MHIIRIFLGITAQRREKKGRFAVFELWRFRRVFFALRTRARKRLFEIVF